MKPYSLSVWADMLTKHFLYKPPIKPVKSHRPVRHSKVKVFTHEEITKYLEMKGVSR